MKKFDVSWIVFGVFILLFYILNSFTDIAIDDYVYKHLITNDPAKIGVRVTSIGDIVSSMQLHYFTTNGRLLVNGLAQLFLMSDNKIIFDIVNSLMLGLLVLLVYLHAGLNLKKLNLSNLLFLILCFWFLIPGINHTLLWVDGSINYLWSINFVLLFLLAYKKSLVREMNVSIFVLPLLFIFGFVCGFTHEVITVGVSGALFFHHITNIKKLKFNTAVLVSGFMLGTLLLIIAPGNFIRLEVGTKMNVGIVNLLIQRCGVILSFLDFAAFTLLLMALVILKFKKSDYLNLFLKKNKLFISSIFISFLFIFLAGSYQPRVFFGVAIFSIILLLAIFNDLKTSFNKMFIYSILGLLSVGLLVQWINVRSDLKENYIVFKSDEQIWKNSQHNIFPERQKKSSRFVSEGLGGIDQGFWSNVAMSWYYKKDYMVFIPERLYANLNDKKDPTHHLKQIIIKDLNSTIKDAFVTSNSKICYEEQSGYFCIPITNNNFNFSKANVSFESNANSSQGSLSLKDNFLRYILKREIPVVNKENNFYYIITLDGKKYIVFQKPQQLSINNHLKISLFNPQNVLLTTITL